MHRILKNFKPFDDTLSLYIYFRDMVLNMLMIGSSQVEFAKIEPSSILMRVVKMINHINYKNFKIHDSSKANDVNMIRIRYS